MLPFQKQKSTFVLFLFLLSKGFETERPRGGSRRAPPGADTASWLSCSGRIFTAKRKAEPNKNTGTAKSNPSFSAKNKRARLCSFCFCCRRDLKGEKKRVGDTFLPPQVCEHIIRVLILLNYICLQIQYTTPFLLH